MNINLHRALRYGVLMVSAYAFVRPVMAQQPPLDPAEIGQIADQVIEALIPPEKRVSRVSVHQRTVFFDHQRTMKAFGHSQTRPISPSALGLRSPVRQGAETLLEGCDGWGRSSCRELGWGVYVWIEPISLTTSEASVRAHVLWPDRGSTTFETGVAPKGRALLVGYATEVQLARDPKSGAWEYVRRVRTATF